MKIYGIEINEMNLENFYEFDREDFNGSPISSFLEFEDKVNHSCYEYDANDIEFDDKQAKIKRICVECKTQTELIFYLKKEFEALKIA